ncbi:hypothetical protein AL049_13245 [Pseudomonas syringae pv. cerasicola]|nr:hypothetical protein AL049_13245 [Pseudomonas syringae pv. cerasicola]
MGPGHQLFKVSQEAISASLLFLAGIFEFGEGLLHARNAHGEGGWLKELSVPRVGTVGYFCSASLTQEDLEIRGMLFVYNHDGGWDSTFYDVFYGKKTRKNPTLARKANKISIS